MSRVQVEEHRQVAPHEIVLMDALADALARGDTDFYSAHEQEWQRSSLGHAFHARWCSDQPSRPITLDAITIWNHRNAAKPAKPVDTTQAIWAKWNGRH
ncbi:hypothetical protein SAMN02983003_1338 [Devosia enhydra]|uniref:Uncharacterized protein n=1 Tax=Devosia enhydra TaxID=665118 RepID=A0A1K2HW30_9HYPH|nr:hypothetical protein [Devosia enhydra]SFZ82898.1 hypothetical protein SAMN02983003_1338 [Devosia enhydra]